MLFLRRFQNFSLQAGNWRSRLGITLCTASWIRWRSAAVILDGAGPIVSVGAALSSGAGVADGATVADALGCARGAGELSNQFTKFVVGDPVLPRTPPGIPNARS